MRLPLAAVVVGTAISSTARAEPRRSLDVSGFAGVSSYSSDVELGNSWAPEQVPGTGVVVGGRAGLTLLPDLLPASKLDPQLGVEAELGFAMASTGENVMFGRASYFAPVLGWRAHLIARLRTHGVIDPHLVVGVGGESVLSGSPFMAKDTDPAFHWGIGATWHASPAWIARIDLRHELEAGRKSHLVSTFELQLGIEKSFDLGGAAEKPAPRPILDSDHDGIPDDVDKCPHDPETQNGYQDQDGCPDDPDRDHDGIANEQDKCPDDAEDKDGFQDADGCPDLDNDGDGIPDTADKCPNDAEDKDGFQDADGCPDPDNDGDTIPDAQDKCPNDPETWNGFEDLDGCPDDLPKAVKQFTGAIEGIQFEYSRARILARSKKVLGAAAEVLRQFPELRIKITGHTDSHGKPEKNQTLSKKRAEAVKWFLVDQGIAADRIETEGVGSAKPRASNKTKAGRAKNRRIEFEVIAPAGPPGPATQPATQPTSKSQAPPPTASP